MLTIELKKFQHIWINLSFVVILAGIVYLLIHVYINLVVPFKPLSHISLSPIALITYSAYSTIRMCAAYGLSLLFALGYGYIAARTRFGDVIMVPLLDVLQSIPVLSLMPAIVLFFISLFPHSNFGLELAAIVMIFTAMSWNMAFSVYQSLKAIPNDLDYVSSIYQFSRGRKFISLELPYSSISLIWNSMMSFAGGWFFLSVNEAFVLGKQSYMLRGIGAYMSVAQGQSNARAMVYSLIAMGIIIALVDRLLWKPLIVWSGKFKIEDTSSGQEGESLVLNYLKRLTILRTLKHLSSNIRERKSLRLAYSDTKDRIMGAVVPVLKPLGVVIIIGVSGAVLFGIYRSARMLLDLSEKDIVYITTSVLLTFSRVLATIAIGILWAVPAGVYIGMRKRLATKFQPLIQFLASYPAPMLYPIALLVLEAAHIGLGIGSVLLMLLGTQWYILYNTVSGSMSLSDDLIGVTRLFSIKGFTLWKKVIIPAIAPQLITGIITAAGGAWNASIVAEYVSYRNNIISTRGIGTLLNRAIEKNDFHLLFGGTFAMILIVVLINMTVWKRLYRKVSQLSQLES
ncbi:MAG: ABC transporter permease subunit [Deltaproteobacteria bacterium]|nr:ABC transporter permease subunit [Deltaproteobacteria bacterium]MCL5277090.1 ABC transporter permease subunit [Deltaproteobacteria bacterium]